MQSLELKPSLLIMTMGYPGAGKTFFARQFAEQYELPYVSEDRVRYELFEKPQFNNDEQDIIDRICDYTLEQVMRTQKVALYDGNFSEKSTRERVAKLAKTNGYRTLIVWLQTDNQTAQYRSSHRDRRNPDSKYAFEVDPQTFTRLISKVQRPSDKEAFVVISGKHAFKGQSLTVLRKITDLYASSITSANQSATIAQETPRTTRPLIQ